MSRVDLRGLQLTKCGLVDAQLRHANLARSWLHGTRLDRSDLDGARADSHTVWPSDLDDTHLRDRGVRWL